MTINGHGYVEFRTGAFIVWLLSCIALEFACGVTMVHERRDITVQDFPPYTPITPSNAFFISGIYSIHCT